MLKNRIIGGLAALTMTAAPVTAFIATNSSTIVNSLTASAATPGCYRPNCNAEYKLKCEGNNWYGHYSFLYGPVGTIPRGTYISCSGETYNDGGTIYLSAYYNGKNVYVKESDLTYYCS